ncbi:MAG: SGNH/GDSL hydrolase family protein [Planctomycetota bacterium]
MNARPDPPRRRLLPRLALLVIAGAMAVVAAELAYRVHLYGPRALTPEGMNSIRTVGEAGMTQAAAEWELRYELRPELHMRFKLARFQTNAHGLRDDPVERVKPTGGWRAAFVGDSYTMGSGVEHAALFHTRLESAWRAANPDRSIECLNFGVAGYNLFAYVGLVRHRVMAFDPDLVVVCLASNDFKQPHQSPDLAPYEPRPLDHPFWRLRLFHPIGGPAATRQAGLLPWPRTAPALAPSRGQRDSEGARRAAYVAEQLETLRELCAAQGTQLALVFLCHETDAKYRRLGDEVEGHAKALGIPFFNTQPLFAGTQLAEFQIFPDDRHPNAAANQRFAEGLGAFLADRGLTPARPRSDG